MDFRTTKPFIRLNQVSILLYLIVLTLAWPSVDIKCTYEYEQWGLQSIGVIYECECKQSIKVSERNTSVSSVTGMHIRSASNSDVGGIHIIGATYLPKGIENFFPNLVGLSVEQHLKEITKNDLQPFPNLKHVWLARNQLEVIEGDLFEYNPDLVFICLKQNFIKAIGPNVFDHLERLTILELDRNDCISDNAVGRYFVLRLIEQTKEECAVKRVEQATTTTVPARMEMQFTTPEELIEETRILSEKLQFWKNFTIVLLSVVALVMIAVIGVLIKRHGDYAVAKFVSFRNS